MPILRSISCLLVISIVLAAPCSDALAFVASVKVPWETGMRVGGGFDSAAGSMEGLDGALDPATRGAFRPAVCPFERKLDLELVDSLEQYTRRIGVTAEAEINAIVAKATGTLGFARETMRDNRSIYLMLRDERVNCHHSLAAPRLSAAAERTLADDAQAFRRRYGDRFLSTVTTGGNFYAIVEIKVRDEAVRDELRFRLKAKVMGVTVFSWGFKKVFEELVDEHEASITAFIDKSVLSFGEDTDALFARYAQFLGDVSSPACSGRDDGYRECPLRFATFEDYQQITRFPVGAGAELQRAMMTELAEHRRAYADLAARATDIEASIDQYQYEGESRITRLQRVRALVADIERQVSSLESAYDACRASPAGCRGPEQLGLVAELTLERRLPVRRDRYPSTCAAAREKLGLLRDARVRLYFQGDAGKPFDALCVAMHQPEPETYLPLSITSPATEHPRVNFSRRSFSDGSATHALASVFAALKVRIVDGGVVVLPAQTRFVQHVGSTWSEQGQEVRGAELSAPRACGDGGEPHLASLSLKGTPWRIARDNQLTEAVAPRGEGGWTLSEDRRTLDAYGESRDGCVTLGAVGALKLEYAGEDSND